MPINHAGSVGGVKDRRAASEATTPGSQSTESAALARASQPSDARTAGAGDGCS